MNGLQTREVMAEEKQNDSISAPRPSDPEKGAKTKPGGHWKANEEHVLPPNNIPVVFAGLMCCTFLAALDQVRHVQRKLSWRE